MIISLKDQLCRISFFSVESSVIYVQVIWSAAKIVIGHWEEYLMCNHYLNGKDKNVLYSIREYSVDTREEIKIDKYVCNWRNKMKLGPPKPEVEGWKLVEKTAGKGHCLLNLVKGVTMEK